MNDTLLREKNQVTLPGEVVEAAGLVPQHDRISWRFEGGEIRGRRAHHAPRPGRLCKDRKTGLLFFESQVTPQEAEEAALSANVDRE